MSRAALFLSRLVLATALALGTTGAVSACSGDGTDVSCNLNSCTVTLDRGVDAKASVLGVDIKLVGVAGDQVSLEVEGNRISVPINGSGGTEVGGLSIQVQQVTGEKVVLQVSKAE